MDYLEPLQVIWDYLCLKQTPRKADCIVGFGNFNTDIARRAAELYQQGLAPKILFTGGLGRNTEGLLPEPEAVRVLVLHENIPNMISNISAAAAREGINIENMINRSKKDMSVTVMEMSELPSRHALDTLAQLKGIIRIRTFAN